MRVTEVINVKGRGAITIVECEFGEKVNVGDLLTDGKGDWRVIQKELGPATKGIGLILRRTDGIGPPDEGAELTVKPVPLLDRKIADVTVRDAVEILSKQSEERVLLAGYLKELGQAINLLELNMDKDKEVRMAAFKHMRECFNNIPPRWMHK